MFDLENINKEDFLFAQKLDQLMDRMDYLMTQVNFDNLQDEFLQAKKNSGVSVLVIDTHPTEWTEGGAFWEVGVSGSSSDSQIQSAHKRQVDGKANRRL